MYEAANWVLCGGLAAAFLSIMVFDTLHSHSEAKVRGMFDCLVSHLKHVSGQGSSSSLAKAKLIAARLDFLKTLSVVLILAFALFDLKPHFTVVGSPF